ncbi:MAG: 4-hydroxybenzoate polyprenyltransferase [Phycisphaerales bacterium]|jgi:4-hydroxybenzoate polyprenyltransferase|nr:4-hydroxybenzoate polyprenyltransferase [Phycisphaerales bacterium]
MTIAVEPHSTRLATKLAHFAGDIKISHTVFAMPWAVLAAVMAWERVRGPIVGKLAIIVVCMIAARTTAMAANRLLDAELDKRNPRTARRAIPSGRLSPRFVGLAMMLSAGLFIAATSLFWISYDNVWPLVLSVPVLVFICAYPLLKRFSRLCHYYLGAALALAPICAWIAVSGGIDWPPILMAGAVLCWTAGFDIIYACQDFQSDRETGVVSVPAKFGIARALWISRATHFFALVLLIALGVNAAELSVLYFVGVALAAVLLIVEHAIVKPDELSKVGLAFFTINGVISLLIGALGVIDVLT